MVAWPIEPYPDLNYDYNLPPEIKQIDRRIVKMLNEYFGILKVSCGTINVNTLHKMCLLKLLRDVIDSDGPLHVFMQQSEAKDWTDYIKRCFNELVYKDGAMDIDPEENVCPPAPEPTPPGPEPTDKYIVSISVQNPKQEFYIGEPFSLGSGTIIGTYNDRTTAVIPLSSCTVSGYDSSSVGEQTVRITYVNSQGDSIYTTYPVVVSSKYINRIAITTMPTTVTFQVGGEFVFDGVVTGYYNTSGSLNITPLVTFSGDDLSQAGSQTVTVHYINTLGEDLTATYQITVVERPVARIPESLTLYNPKTSFTTGDPWVYAQDSTSYIEVSYSNGDTARISSNQCTITGNDTTTASTGRRVTMYYTETINNVPYTVSNYYNIVVTQRVVTPTKWYIGTSDIIPSATTIKSGTNVSIDTNTGTSPLLNKLVFWIALPQGKSLVRAENLNFEGDIIYPNSFATSSVTIDGFTYTLYTITHQIPANIRFNVYIQ